MEQPLRRFWIFSIIARSTCTFLRSTIVAHHTCTFCDYVSATNSWSLVFQGSYSNNSSTTVPGTFDCCRSRNGHLSIRTNWPTKYPTQEVRMGWWLAPGTQLSKVSGQRFAAHIIFGSVKVSRDKDTCGVRSNRCQTFIPLLTLSFLLLDESPRETSIRKFLLSNLIQIGCH